MSFNTTVHGKWILAGEHAVLRGCPALVFPVRSKSLTLSYQQTQDAPKADFGGNSGEDAHMIFWSVIEAGLEKVGKSLSDTRGKFHLHNEIPIGAGMGASGALCVAVSHWFVNQKWIEESDVYEFARSLENLFHSESSGVDIAGTLYGEGIVFTRQGEQTPIKLTWQPNWYPNRNPSRHRYGKSSKL